MNVANNMDKSVVVDGMNDEEKLKIVVNTRSNHMLMLLGIIKIYQVKKILILQKFVKNC